MQRSAVCILVLLVGLPVVSARAGPHTQQDCHSSGTVVAIHYGTQRCQGENRGWACVAGAGLQFWHRPGLYLALTTRCHRV